jgi:hypothetical protein
MNNMNTVKSIKKTTVWKHIDLAMHVAARERLVVSTDVPSTNACIHGKVDPEGD